MPERFARICGKPGCSLLTRGSYCEAHKHYGWELSQRGKTKQQRGYGGRWEVLRKRVLERDHYLCMPCLKEGKVHEANQVDHIIPKADGGTDAMSNLQAINKRCHGLKTSREGRASR